MSAEQQLRELFDRIIAKVEKTSEGNQEILKILQNGKETRIPFLSVSNDDSNNTLE